jgi:hypothetical protein
MYCPIVRIDSETYFYKFAAELLEKSQQFRMKIFNNATL